MNQPIEDVVTHLFTVLDSYPIEDWLVYSSVCREITQRNVQDVLRLIPNEHILSFYDFIENTPTTDAEWNEYRVIGGESNSGTASELERKAKLRNGVEIIRKHISINATQ